MNCDDARRELIDLVFGDPDTGIALNLHLAECASCRAEERHWLALREAARGETATPSQALRERIRRALPERPAFGAGAALGRPVPAYVAIAAALVGALGVFAVMKVRVPDAPRLMAPAPIAQPGTAPGGAKSFFTATGCYATGVGSSARLLLAIDSTGGTWRVARDSS